MIRSKSNDENSPSYQFYTREGTKTIYQDLVRQLAQAHIVLFGELHNRTVVHMLQYEVTRGLYEIRERDLILGAEMFEADNQLIVDEYLAGMIKHKHLVNEAKVWGNYDPDYRPLVEFAKENRLPFIASNIPKRYANLVARQGIRSLESLSDEAKHSIAPLPIEVDLATPGYREMMTMSRKHGMYENPENFVAAQAVKDATMAYFILKNFSERRLFLHYNGDYHSREYGGIYWYIKKARPDLQVVVLATVESETLNYQDEYEGLGDYILLIPG
jgi:uncharacterized iron-regulated protein